MAQLETVQITVNGSILELPAGSTVADLLRALEIEPRLVAVEQNLEIVPKADFNARKIFSGDRFEVVHFVGGG